MAKEWKSTATLLRGALDRVERHIHSQEDNQSGFSAVLQGVTSDSTPNHSSEAIQGPHLVLS